MSEDLITRLSDEADLCRNETATDIANLLDEARNKILEQLGIADLLRRELSLLQEKFCDREHDLSDRLLKNDEPPAKPQQLTI